MNTATLKHIYFLGIGGIGMSALARYFNACGVRISGYDKTPSSLTAVLQSEGISIHFTEAVDLIPVDIDMVIYTPAVPDDNAEYQHLKALNIPIMKRAEMLEKITEGLFTIAIAGTHGKTTVSSMIAHMLHTAGMPVNAFLGGISVNTGSNMLLNPSARMVVTEADEYDRSFLKLSPDIAVVTAIDADHLDIYGTLENLRSAFGDFVKKIRSKGHLFAQYETGIEKEARVPSSTFGISGGDCFATNIEVIDGHFFFNLHLPDMLEFQIKMGVPGRYNIENAVVSAAVCHHLGIGAETIGMGLQEFRGVKRRFEVHVNHPSLKYVDDYAHHPEEIRACLLAVRELWPGMKLTVIFQPHLYTRTRDFADGFCEVLGHADTLLLLPIYPARESSIPGINSEMLLNNIQLADKKLVSKDLLLTAVQHITTGVVITMGAGDIDQEVEELSMHFSQKIQKEERS